MKKTVLYLASTSPRRKQLLSDYGFDFTIVSPNSPEIEKRGESPRSMVLRLAREKAWAAFQDLVQTLKLKKLTSLVILSADTTVVDPSGRGVLNKPTSKRDAHRILNRISGRTHSVLTGYCLLQIEDGRVKRTITRAVRTSVTMKKISGNQIVDYIRSGEPMDKAGAYAAQGIGMAFIRKIQGSYSNVVGLPMTEITEDLDHYFNLRPKWVRK